MSTRTLLSAAAAVLLFTSAAAQDQTPPAAAPAPTPADAPAVQVAGADPTHNTASRDKDTLSVDFPDEDIKTILRNVADLFELNLVVPDTLVGRTSIKLRDVTWRQIFQVVLSPVNYTFIEESNIIKIVSQESLAQEPVSTEVFILNNAKAQDIKPTVDGLVDAAAGGKILIDARSNALVVTERPSRMTRVRTIIEQLDKATAQVMIESQFVEVTDSDIRNIGVNWASLQGFRVGVGGMTQTFARNRGQDFSNGSTTTGNTSVGSTSNSGRNSSNETNSSTNNGTTGSTNNGTTNSSTLGTTGSTSNGTTGATAVGTTGSTRLGQTFGSESTYVATPDGVNSVTNNFGSGAFNPATGGVSGITPNPANATLGAAGYVPASVDPTTGAVTPASFTAPYTFNGSGTNQTNSGTTNSTDSGTTSSTNSGTTSSTSSGTTGSTNSGTTTATSSGSLNSVVDTLANSATNAVNSAVQNLIGLTNTGGTSRLTSAVFSASDFNIVISALKTQSNTKVVSNPTVVTLNNTEAVINIGSEFPIPSYTYNSERGTFEVSGFQYKPIGVILKVTPQVNAQGNIRLALEPEISSSNRQTTFGGAGGASIPIIDTRKVKTQISLQDGYTAGIGGLISTSKTNGGTKVPVLGDIPILGRLFSSKNVNDQTTNLLIFITAKSVNPDGAAPEDIFRASALEAAGVGGAPRAEAKK